jgi:uncharacterized membrane-anchored protein YitT (DUF2179 family)
MRFQQKLAAALELLASTGMRRSSYAPPLHRFLWRIGASVPPPHFLSFTANLVSAGVWFGVVWGLLMWLAVWPWQGISPHRAFAAALFAGLLFGLFVAVRYRHGANKHRIPLWKDFQPADEHART